MTEDEMEADAAVDSKMLKINAKPEPIEIDLTRAAVVVVDMQNAFVSEGGMFDEAGYDISGAAAAVEANAEVLPALREAGVKIVYLKMSYSADYSDSGGPQSPNWHKELGLVLMQDRPENWGRYVTEGTWDEEIREEIAPCPGDVVVRKQRYSGFAGTNLDQILKTAGVRHVFYTGVATNVCVESTLRDGFFLDYWPILVSDACNNSGPEHNRLASEWNVEHAFGWVTTTHDILRALAEN
jgi:ureidoacrylate peracid hydrolase